MMKFCKECVYPESAVNLYIDDEGVCSSCHTFEAFGAVEEPDWEKKLEKLRKRKLLNYTKTA